MLLVLLLAVGPPARGEDVLATGTAGTPGVPGAAGQSGGPGGPGQDADADASGDPENSATATGGVGGAGGAGGSGSPQPVGGSGGAGGNATASSESHTSDVWSNAHSTARGGAGGAGGGPNLFDGPGGAGGSANATALATSATSDASADARSTGGLGASGRSAGDGGSALAEARVEGGASDSDHQAFALATGGRGGNAASAFVIDPALTLGGDGGDATSSVSATGAAKDMSARAVADGGAGGLGTFGPALADVEGDGGDAHASASAESSGSRSVVVQAIATGGNVATPQSQNVSRGGTGGVATATARGVSTGGADVHVSAVQTSGSAGGGGTGGDSVAENAVSGSTSGALSLTQISRAGAGGDAGTGARAGDARSILLDARNEGGGDLNVLVEASGGTVRRNAEGGGAVAEVHATAAGDSDVRVDVDALAGGGGAEVRARAEATSAGSGFVEVEARARGGLDTQLSASGTSTGGGDVRVVAIREGQGGNGSSADAFVENAVHGSTTGALTLEQRALAGVSSPSTRNAVSTLGFSDDLSSSLDVTLEARGGLASVGSAAGTGFVAAVIQHMDAAPVALHVISTGGRGAASSSPSNAATDGGSASLGAVYASSAGGDVTIDADVRAGDGNEGLVGVGGNPPRGSDGGSVELINRTQGDTPATLTLTQKATGGDGGRSHGTPGAGGDATSILDVTKSLALLAVTTEATAGAGGGDASGFERIRGDGGTALASTTAHNDAGDVDAKATAYNGRSGDGNATAFVDATASGDVFVEANAFTSEARAENQPLAGVASIERARGVSTGGGSVHVSAQLLQGGNDYRSAVNGRSVSLENFVEGETSGELHLSQTVAAGHGAQGGVGRSVLERHDTRSVLALSTHAASGISWAADGVDSEAVSNARNDGGDARVSTTAYGGSSEAQHGGDGHVTATARAQGDVEVDGRAYGGNGDTPGIGVLDEVSGTSDGGGAVRVRGEIGAGHSFTSAGRDVEMVDAIDGTTTGSLTLHQVALGGGSAAGAGGGARSALSRSDDVAALQLVSEALGGGSNGSAAGGGADAEVAAENTAGTAAALGLAAGGSGLRGADAEVVASATTHRDGDAVQVGQADATAVGWGAHGGTGGWYAQTSLGGGAASSRSTGTALGDAEVRVYDRAIGGASRHEQSPPDFGGGVPGAGGDAVSDATAIGAGLSRVDAWSRAHGGAGESYRPLASAGGAADATSHATGLGEVHALADATAGLGFAAHNGSATALAVAEGASGDATARAASSVSGVTELSVSSGAAIDGGARAFARVDAGAPSLRAAGLVGGASDVESSAALGSLQGGVQTVAEARFSLAPGAGAGSQLFADLVLAFDDSDELLAQDVELIFLDPQGEGSGLESLRLTAFIGDLLVLDETALGIEAAIALLEGRVIDAGDALDAPNDFDDTTAPPALRVALAFESSDPGWSFDVQLRVVSQVVPEPGTALLLALGLAFLRRRRRG
jgi:hypothetical protein